jgi:sugar/nucleoside kinase (ribokinase family)
MPRYDVLAIGNAIVDCIAHADEAFLQKHVLRKGTMQLIDEAHAQALYATMREASVISGGSAANTMVGAAALGVRAGFLGKVHEDELGRLFAHDIQAAHVAFPSRPSHQGPATARCLILVTPDGERTMNTYLGACREFGPEDVHEEEIAAAGVLYLEGYLWDPPQAKAAMRKALDIAHMQSVRTALTLSDVFCVDRWRDEFLALIREGQIDLLFANIHEVKSLYQTTDEQTALDALAKEGITVIVTRSADGAMAHGGQGWISVHARRVDQVVDTTGAGDLFAAGVLAGLAKAQDLSTCLTLGTIAAAEIIQHVGARPHVDILDLARRGGMKI